MAFQTNHHDVMFGISTKHPSQVSKSKPGMGSYAQRFIFLQSPPGNGSLLTALHPFPCMRMYRPVDH